MNECFEFMPCKKIANIEQRNDYKKLSFASVQQNLLDELFHNLPRMDSFEQSGKTYTLSFPDGIPDGCRFMRYSDGGIGNAIVNQNGKIVGHASMREVTSSFSDFPVTNPNLITVYIISEMMVQVAQLCLEEIRNEFRLVNQNLKKILDFLYGEKKAELLAEVNFVTYARKNFSSIMAHEQQRIATITNLQEARKVAMKDIEFYMADLDSFLNQKSNSDIVKLVNDTLQTNNCMMLSLQLYIMSIILEVYYSQNRDEDYISEVEEATIICISEYEKRMLSAFAKLATLIQEFKGSPLKKVRKEDLLTQITPIMERLGQGAESEMCKSFRKVLHASERKSEFYIDCDNGEIYMKSL